MDLEYLMNDEFGNEAFRAFCEVPDFIVIREQFNMAAYISYPLVVAYLMYILYKNRSFDLLVIVAAFIMLFKTYAGIVYFRNPSFETMGIYGVAPVFMIIFVAIIVMWRYMQWHWASCILALFALMSLSSFFTMFWVERIGFDDFSTGTGSIVHLPHLFFFLILIVALFVRHSASRCDQDLDAARYLVGFWIFYAISTALNWFDIHLCSSIPTGSKFLGYIASAAMLVILLRGAVELKVSRLKMQKG